jgi:hypothetical protein
MNNLWRAIIACMALSASFPAAAAPLDDEAARLAAIERENAILRKENAALRERTRLQDENAKMRERLGEKTRMTAPSDPVPLPPNGSRRVWVQEPAPLPPAAAAAIADPRIASAYMAVKARSTKRRLPPSKAAHMSGSTAWARRLISRTSGLACTSSG